jgi:uncharacterized protein (DUF111 family)
VATHIQLDALGGIAGDMFVASVLDAWPELLDDTIAAIRAAGENLDIVGISLADHRDDVFAGQRFANFENSESELEQHRTLEDIESILRGYLYISDTCRCRIGSTWRHPGRNPLS